MFEVVCKLGQLHLIAFTTVLKTNGVFWYVVPPEHRQDWPKQPNPFFLRRDATPPGVEEKTPIPKGKYHPMGVNIRADLTRLGFLEKKGDPATVLSDEEFDEWSRLRTGLFKAGLIGPQGDA